MRFICDVMLGKLAKYLRIFGFDAVYLTDPAILKDYARQDDPPYFLTRRRENLGYSTTMHIKSENVREQLNELRGLIKGFIDPEKVLTRCINCNLTLSTVEKEAIEHRVPEFVFHKYNVFKMCPRCQRVYWAGTHAEHLAKLIQEVIGEDLCRSGVSGVRSERDSR
jgi:uncharacterized protein